MASDMSPAEALRMIAGTRVFVTSRERIKKPEGENLFDQAIAVLYTALSGPAGGESPKAMESAPRDGTMLRLLVEFDDHATEDVDGPAWTIGANNFDNDGDDEWLFAGWCWTHDHFTQGTGLPIGWLPMLSTAPTPPATGKEPQRHWILTEPTPCDEEWVRVPREPTEAMLEAGWDAGEGNETPDYANAYRAMLAAAPTLNGGDQHPDDIAVDQFAEAMKLKLAEARAKGRGGWQDKEDCPQQRLSDMLRAHVAKGDPRDVANFCMFLHQRGEGILPHGGEGK